MKIAIVTVNKNGERIAGKLKACFKEARVFNGRENSASLASLAQKVFGSYNGLIFIGALGIATRLIGPLAKSKFTDPAVVSVDSAGRFAVSLLCGHEGGANQLAYSVAACLDAIPVITTGTQAHKNLVLGIGTRRGVRSIDVKRAIIQVLKKERINLSDIRIIATIDIKKDEEGLLKASFELDIPIVFIPKESIECFKGDLSESRAARRHIGVEGVCEPCALLAGRRAKLILRKEILRGITLAIARESLA